MRQDSFPGGFLRVCAVQIFAEPRQALVCLGCRVPRFAIYLKLYSTQMIRLTYSPSPRTTQPAQLKAATLMKAVVKTPTVRTGGLVKGNVDPKLAEAVLVVRCSTAASNIPPNTQPQNAHPTLK